MSASYTRRINLYINGKQVSNDLVSIRREMSKLINEQARMTMGSKEYVKHTAEIKSLKKIIDEHNQALSTTHKEWNWFQRLSDAANRYFAAITAGIAAIAGGVMMVKSSVDAFAEYDDKLVDVMKTTDLTKQETIALSKEISKINTRTSQNDLLSLARIAGKLGTRGKEDILGFVNATDKIRVALSEDLGGDTEESVRQLGKLVDIFKLTKEYSVEESLLKIGSAMNALGASGTANEGYMLEFSKRVAGVAPNAGFTIDKILGLATTLDELGQTSEVSATAFNQVISNMFKKTPEFARIAGVSLQEFTDLLNKDANEAMILLLEGAKGSSGGFGEMAKSLDELGMDGVRATTVLASLAANIEKLRENQKFSNEEFVKGTDLLKEFNKKNNSAQAVLEKHAKTFKQLQVELGEKLTPVYAGAIHKASTLLKIFGTTVDFLIKHGAALVTLTSLIIAYTLAVKLMAFWETRKNEQIGLGLILAKLNTAAYSAQFAAIALYNAGVALLSGNLKKAAISARAFSAALNMSPIGWIITGIAALIGAIKAYDKYSSEAKQNEKAKAEALKNLGILTKSYTDNLDNLNKTIKTSNALTLEEKRLRKEETDDLIEHLKWEIKRQELEQEAIRQRFQKATLWQKTVNLFKTGWKFYSGSQALNDIDALKNGEEAAASMTEGIQQLASILDGTYQSAKELNEILFAESAGDKIGSESLAMMNEKLAKYRIALDNAIFGGEDYLRIQKKIQAVEAKINKPVWSTDDEIKRRIDLLEASFNKEQALISQNYLQGLINEDEYSHQMLVSEIKFHRDKLKIYNIGTKEYQGAVNKAMELQVNVNNKLRDILLKAEQELAEAKIENFHEEFQRQEEAEKTRWDIEKAALEERLIKKDVLNKKEQAINDAIHAIIQEKEKAHQTTMNNIKAGKNLSDLNNLADAASPFNKEFAQLEEMQKFFDAKNELLLAQYENEKVLAAGNQAALLAAEKRYNDGVLQMKLEAIDAEYLQYEQRVASAQSFVTALAGIAEEHTVMAKALFLFNQGLAVAEIWMSVAKANAQALVFAAATAGQPFIAMNTAVGAAQTALVLAQTVKHFQKSDKKKGYSEGGFTTPGNKNEPDGIVHKSEYVISKEQLSNPQIMYIAQVLEASRQRKTSLSGHALPLLSSGGFSTTNSSQSNDFFKGNNDAIQKQTRVNRDLTQAINKLLEYRPTVAVETIEREREKYIRIKQTHGL